MSVFGVLAVVLGCAFVVIGMQAGRSRPITGCSRVGYWLRSRWMALLVVLGVLVVGISLFDLPYASGGAERDGRSFG